MKHTEKQYFKSLEGNICPLCRDQRHLLFNSKRTKALCGGCTALFRIDASGAAYEGFQSKCPPIDFFKTSLKGSEIYIPEDGSYIRESDLFDL